MGPKPLIPQNTELSCQTLAEQINRAHLLIRLANPVGRNRITTVCDQSFTSEQSRPAASPRLIAGLLYLRQALDLSNEDVVGGLMGNPYWQMFTGRYLHEAPLDPSSLTRWHQRQATFEPNHNETLQTG